MEGTPKSSDPNERPIHRFMRGDTDINEYLEEIRRQAEEIDREKVEKADQSEDQPEQSD